MFNRFAAVFLGCVLLFASRAGAAGSPIDSFTLNTFGGYGQTYNHASTSLSSGLLVIGDADIYHLHNGNTWESGAGGFGAYYAKKSAVAVDGNQIAYTLDLPVGAPLYFAEDYDSGSHSAHGRMVSVEPLVLRATSGSDTAVLAGHARLTMNTYANYTDDRFHFYAAPVGALVPFNVNYKLGNGTWTPTTMDGTFVYTLGGTMDFTRAIVPEPAGVLLVGMLLTASALSRGGRRRGR